jgi:hypothetical protein
MSEPNWHVKTVGLQRGEGYDGHKLKEGVWITIEAQDRVLGECLDLRFFVNGPDWENIRRMVAEAVYETTDGQQRTSL